MGVTLVPPQNAALLDPKGESSCVPVPPDDWSGVSVQHDLRLTEATTGVRAVIAKATLQHAGRSRTVVREAVRRELESRGLNGWSASDAEIDELISPRLT